MIPRELDPAALATYLWNGFVVGPATIVRGISLLPSGTSMTVSIDQPRTILERYWALGPRRKLPAREAVEKLELELVRAARQHLASDVPIGVYLSGGVDSSAVASLAVRSGIQEIKTFHLGFDEARFDEAAYARRVADALGTEHVGCRLTQARFMDDLPRALSSFDQPTADGINTYFLSRMVRDAGITVALAGTGGDELFGGYKSFREIPRSCNALRALGLLPDVLLKKVSDLAVRLKFGVPGEVPPQARWGKLRDVLFTADNLVSMYQVCYGLYTREFISEMVDADVLSHTPNGLPPELYNSLWATSRSAAPLSAISLIELALFIGERLLRDTDAASMASSVEVRLPLLDNDVVEAVLAVSEPLRFLPLGKKTLLRRLAMPQLDPSIFDRPKAGFVLPLEAWAKDRLVPEMESIFSERTILESVGLNPRALGRLWRSFRAGAPGIHWSRLWAPFVLLHWCKINGVGLR
jgi:asparagine synthase (glutamine-hydrolysing)